MSAVPVTLVVNVYERTYRAALEHGAIDRIAAQNRVEIPDRWVLINNVDDIADARSRAQALVSSGELSGFRLVADCMTEALQVTRLPRRALRGRGYFLDFGLAMAITGSERLVLGWDPETFLPEPADWLTPAIELLDSDPRVFSASPRWPTTRDTLTQESVRQVGPWAMNYGFSDQVFLVHRADIATGAYRSFAPASWCRNPGHPFSFEARLEARQRATGRVRASHSRIEYRTNDLDDVIVRTGGHSRREALRRRALQFAGRVVRRVRLRSPRFRLP